ncbi:MAG: hypothetical protein [Caudoviricetes sp.]|nr:MAG: hypothetical protein [Caudoviricetes sp.]
MSCCGRSNNVGKPSDGVANKTTKESNSQYPEYGKPYGSSEAYPEYNPPRKIVIEKKK